MGTESSGQKGVLASLGLEHDAQRWAAELIQANRELHAIYEGIGDGLLVADTESMRFVRTNAAMCQMLGYSEQELLSLSVADIHPPEEVPLALRSFRARACGELSFVRGRRVLRKDGTVFFADIRSQRVNYDGRPCVIGLFRDMTERVESELAMKRDRQILRNLLAASDRDRQLISCEIHDGLAQQLSGSLMHFEAFESLQGRNPELAREKHRQGVRLLQDALKEARRLISGVRPPVLDDAGVVAAIDDLVQEAGERSGRQIDWCHNLGSSRWERVLENTVFRIVQESLTNACRHSQSERIRISLMETDEAIQIEVRDWGLGFDVQNVQSGRFGLESIRERARLLGGTAEIDSQLGRGTAVRVQLPNRLRESEL